MASAIGILTEVRRQSSNKEWFTASKESRALTERTGYLPLALSVI
ncbi:hypothetical protein SAMN05216596_102681 [Pseudomonas congelans]|uniref:Uncharacterized protein n=1 Tax=Pseudomonas congelans TaxID=200452 RepID=A0A1H0PHI5_9PSED|nr:ribosomal protein L13E [Pseudomonas sp. PvP027]SDP04454.1 hypothetical protein SAMN05216596_102681 [Pseudomonas congelans]